MQTGVDSPLRVPQPTNMPVNDVTGTLLWGPDPDAGAVDVIPRRLKSTTTGRRGGLYMGTSGARLVWESAPYLRNHTNASTGLQSAGGQRSFRLDDRTLNIASEARAASDKPPASSASQATGRPLATSWFTPTRIHTPCVCTSSLPLSPGMEVGKAVGVLRTEYLPQTRRWQRTAVPSIPCRKYRDSPRQGRIPKRKGPAAAQSSKTRRTRHIEPRSARRCRGPPDDAAAARAALPGGGTTGGPGTRLDGSSLAEPSPPSVTGPAKNSNCPSGSWPFRFLVRASISTHTYIGGSASWVLLGGG